MPKFDHFLIRAQNLTYYYVLPDYALGISYALCPMDYALLGGGQPLKPDRAIGSPEMLERSRMVECGLTRINMSLLPTHNAFTQHGQTRRAGFFLTAIR